jgi:hypothetical protein
MNDCNLAIIPRHSTIIKTINSDKITIKQVRGFSWLKNENINIKNLRPAAMI